MKKFLIVAAIAIFLIVLGLVGLILRNELDTTQADSYVSHETLPIIKPGWPGTPVDQKGRFVNHEFPFLPKTVDFLKWKSSANPFEEAKQADTARLEVKDPSEFLNSAEDGILWLGHASFFIRLNGVSILTDPVFDKPPLVKTYVDVPSPLALIRAVDLVLLSHDHRDHMDEATLRAIALKFPNAKFLAGLRSEDVLNDWKTAANAVHTAGWFQQFGLTDQNVKIFFLPVRHWSRRGLFDTNYRLWGGYVIKSDKVTIYFGGDSGYGSHYRETGALFPEIDYFLIGIGAFEPRWFMEPSHNSPADALKAFEDSGAKLMIPMHFGRFDLSDEPPGEALRQLMSRAESKGVGERIRVLMINGSLEIP